MEQVEARPTLPAVAAARALPKVVAWLGSHDKQPQDTTSFLFALTHLYDNISDAFVMAKFAEEQWKWPADEQLVVILYGSYREALELHDRAVKEWVMRSGVRFPLQPRDPVLFRDADGELTHGIVQNVLSPTAEAIVAVVTDLDERSRNTPLVKIKAEEVVPRAAV